jgi:hypothetical protein
MSPRKTPNKTHAKYEAACGLDDIIGLLHPELKGKAVVDGKPFPCPICGPTNPQKIRITSGRKNPKPYWKCTGKHDSKSCDTVDFIMMSMRMKYSEAITIWAALAAADPKDWRSVIEAERPNWYRHQGEAKCTDTLMTQEQSDKLADACAKDEQRSYFDPNPLDDALAAFKKAISASNELKGDQARILLDKLKESLEGKGDAA